MPRSGGRGANRKDTMKPTTYKAIEFRGKTYEGLADLAHDYNITRSALYNRLRAGMDLERAVTSPMHQTNRYEYKGQLYTFGELSKLSGINYRTLKERIRLGMPLEEAMTRPVLSGRHTKPKEPPRPVKKRETWQPHQSVADKRKCSKCRYSERDGATYPCMYLVLHNPPERRPCEPGKDCTVFLSRTRETERRKQRAWKVNV